MVQLSVSHAIEVDAYVPAVRESVGCIGQLFLVREPAKASLRPPDYKKVPCCEGLGTASLLKVNPRNLRRSLRSVRCDGMNGQGGSCELCRVAPGPREVELQAFWLGNGIEVMLNDLARTSQEAWTVPKCFNSMGHQLLALPMAQLVLECAMAPHESQLGAMVHEMAFLGCVMGFRAVLTHHRELVEKLVLKVLATAAMAAVDVRDVSLGLADAADALERTVFYALCVCPTGGLREILYGDFDGRFKGSKAGSRASGLHSKWRHASHNSKSPTVKSKYFLASQVAGLMVYVLGDQIKLWNRCVLDVTFEPLADLLDSLATQRKDM